MPIQDGRGNDGMVGIARWAASLLASSLVLAVTLIFVFLSVSDAGTWFREHPVGAIAVGLLVISYFTSLFCLHKLQKGAVSESIPLWSLSFAASCVPLVLLIYWSRGEAGVLVVAGAEVAAVVLHVVAVCILLARKQRIPGAMDGWSR
jgi:hypothetical protein